jgi:hypothetical protein
MFRLSLAVLLLTATAAQAGTGGDFCETIRAEYVACIYEAGTRSGGDYLRKCERANATVQDAHQDAVTSASNPLRSELDKAAALWKEVTTSPLPAIGETPEVYKARSKRQADLVNAECESLYGLDNN